MDRKTRPLPILVLILGTLTALGPLSIDLYLPAFPEMARDMAVPISAIQLSLTSFFIGLAIGQVLYGPVLDRLGRKPPIYFGLTLYIFSSIACALADGAPNLVALRFIQALGGCVGMVASRAVVRDLFNERETARVFSLLMLVMGAAPILAPLLGGYLSAAFGWRFLFWILAVVALATLACIALYLPESKGPNPHFPLRTSFHVYLGILKGRRFVGYAVAGGLAQAGMFAYITGSPFVFIEFFEMSSTAYSWLFGVNAFGLIAASQLNVRILEKRKPEQILTFSFSVLALAGLALIGSALMNLGLWSILIPLFIYIAFLGVTLPNTMAAALAAEGARAGSASALLGTLQFSFGAVTSAMVSYFDNGTTIPMAAGIAVCGSLALITAFVTTRSVT